MMNCSNSQWFYSGLLPHIDEVFRSAVAPVNKSDGMRAQFSGDHGIDRSIDIISCGCLRNSFERVLSARLRPVVVGQNDQLS